MRIHTDFSSLNGIVHPVLTIGTFDGVHLGHQAIITRLKEVASRSNGETVLLTFYPHPRMVLHPDDHDLKLLNSPHEKARLLEMAGIQHLVVYPFSEDFSRMSAFDYVRDLLVNGIHAKTVVVGYDHRFGRNREGDFEVLKEMSEIFGFAVEEIPARDIDAIRVSSTKIRDALNTGNVNKASRLLGYNYRVTGTVVHGDGRGATIGFPTANIRVDYPYKLIPGRGVYAVNVNLNDRVLQGVLNIGVRPTIHSNASEQIEVFLLEFDQNIYGENLSVEFVEWIRDEQKFGSIDDLKKQIAEDIVSARKYV
ncbi:MAG: bifunctional riboflavin kinase/FAD synthetase [Crocinitomicaceae bacterium]|nr:bifunctional riboflavin kinase/FAD synthetase [Crocinitomicaceae bacterium]